MSESAEVSQIKKFCRDFELLFHSEIHFLLEYSLQMQVVDTYSSDGEHKRAHVSFKFVLLKGNEDKVSFLKAKITDFTQFKSV